MTLFFEREAVRPTPPPAKAVTATEENLNTDLLATWWAQRPGGNWYWRCDVPAKHLPGQVLGLTLKDLRDHPDGITVPRQRGSAAIWSYPGNASRGMLMGGMQQAGFRVLIEVDDNYLIGAPHLQTKSREWSMKIDPKQDSYSHEAHRRLCGFADGVIVTTETLAEAYREVNPNVYVCRNSVDPEDWAEPVKPNDGVLRIGYAASHSHLYDAADIHRALSWAASQRKVEVVMFGLDPKWSFTYTMVPWTKDLAEYRRSLQVLDVGLCPLRPGKWADGKSDIKLMEYAMSGACSVIADRPPYQDWVDRPEALTARTPKEFLKQVKWLIANRDAVRELAAACKDRVLRERTIHTEIKRWRDAVA